MPGIKGQAHKKTLAALRLEFARAHHYDWPFPDVYLVDLWLKAHGGAHRPTRYYYRDCVKLMKDFKQPNRFEEVQLIHFKCQDPQKVTGILAVILMNTGLPLREIPPGKWIWDYSDISRDRWDKAKHIIRRRLNALAEAGVIEKEETTTSEYITAKAEDLKAILDL